MDSKISKVPLVLMITILGTMSIAVPTANAQTDQTSITHSPMEAGGRTNTADPSLIPYRQTTLVYSDPTSYLDEYALIASVPANVFRDDDENLYAAPIIFGDSMAGDYLLEDWKAYCEHWGGVSYVDFVGPYSSDYVSHMKDYLGTEKYTLIVADDPHEYAAEIALNDWSSSDTAVIAPANTYLASPETIYGESHGEFFNITEEYYIEYPFGYVPPTPPPGEHVAIEPPIESPHPYPSNASLAYSVQHLGAAYISVHFPVIDVEEGWDYLYIYDEYWSLITEYTGYHEDVWTPPVPGELVYITLVSDLMIEYWGFIADAYVWSPTPYITPPEFVLHEGEWLNFTVPANITGVMIANVELLNWTSAVGETRLACFLIDPEGNVVDYDFTPAHSDWYEIGYYTWTMWDINEHPTTTTENYTVAIYSLGFDAADDYGLLVGGLVYGYSGKPGNLDVYTITVPENAKELDAWLSFNSTEMQMSYGFMWLIDPKGNVLFPNLFEYKDTELPPPIYMSNLGRLNAPHPTPGNWTLIVEAPPAPPAPPRPTELTVEYTVQYEIALYNEEKPDYVEAAANGAVIASLSNAPLLYTATNTLPAETKETLQILHVEKVILVDPAGIVSDTVRNAITEMGIAIAEDLVSLEEAISYIRGLSGETDLVLTVPTDSFFAPATLAGAFHGAPVLVFKGSAKEIPTLADSTWAWQYFAHEWPGISPLDWLLKAPPIHWMHELSKEWSEWIGGLGADAAGMESVLTVAPLVDVKPVFERAIQGIAKAGRIPGYNAEEDVAFVNRAMIYPAIIYANPGYGVTMPSLVSYDYGLPDILSDISPDLVQPLDYKPPPEYIYSVNDWDNTTDAMEGRGFTLDPHIGKYIVYDRLTSGVAFWYHSNHGGLGFVWDYLPFGQGFVGLWYEDPPDPQPKRGYEYNQTTYAENASVPDQYNLYGYNLTDGVVYQAMGEPFSWAFGGEFDRWLGNIHSVSVVFMDCYVGGSLLPLTMMRHGAASVIGDMRTGLLIDTDLFCVKYTQEVMAGKTLGEAFVAAATKAGYVYPNTYFEMTLFSPAWIHNYTVYPGYEIPWYVYPYVDDCSNAYVLYGDPDMVLVDATVAEPEALDPLEMVVGEGHEPGHVTRSISVSITSPAGGAYVGGITSVSWTISSYNTVLESALLHIDESVIDVTGQTSYLWNTTTVLDGNHTITLVAADPIDNVNSTAIWITVDNTSPINEIREPVEGAYLRSTHSIAIYGYDANLDLMELYIDGDLVKILTVGGTQTYTWDTTTSDERTYTIKLIVYDEAGNSVEKTVTVTVDNTNPSVSITSPAAEVELSGTSTITFIASDNNLESVQLIIDESVFDVTGRTSFTWNTTTVGDGSHAIKLVAYDKAGNVAEASLTVTTINVRLAIEATRNMYIAISTPIGLVIGVAVAWAILKRKMAQAAPPAPTSS